MLKNRLKNILNRLAVLTVSIVIAFLAIFKPVLANSQQSDLEKSILELLEVTNVEQQMNDMINSQIEQINQAMISSMGKTVSEQEKEIVLKHVKEMQLKLHAAIDYKTLYIKSYSKVFNQEEIEGLITFYRTDLGQKVIVKLPILMQEIMMDMMPKLQKVMIDEMPKFKQAIESDLAKLRDSKIFDRENS